MNERSLSTVTKERLNGAFGGENLGPRFVRAGGG